MRQFASLRELFTAIVSPLVTAFRGLAGWHRVRFGDPSAATKLGDGITPKDLRAVGNTEREDHGGHEVALLVWGVDVKKMTMAMPIPKEAVARKGPLDALVAERSLDRVAAARGLLTFLDLNNTRVASWSEMNDASELLVGLALLDKGIRELVAGHLVVQFDFLHSRARGIGLANNKIDIDTVRVLIDTAALVGVEGWLSVERIEAIWEDLCGIFGSRQYVGEKVVVRIGVLLADHGGARAGAILARIVKDPLVRNAVYNNPIAVAHLATACRSLGLPPVLVSDLVVAGLRDYLDLDKPLQPLTAARRNEAIARVERILG